MTGDEAPTLSVDDLYGELADADIDPLLDASLAPRSPDLLFELGGGLGASQSSVVLDVGCRDGRQLLELHTRFGCRGVGVDPVATNLARAREAVGAAPVELVLGRAESLPFAAGSFDLVWVRDVLVHVEALADALAECRRVVRRGGAVLVFQMFATEWLEPAESARLWAPLAVVPASTDRATFESAATVAGLGVERRDELRSEWREHREEQGDRRTSRQLLRAARLLRDPDRYRAAMGENAYAIELADCLWGVYQMVGKLSPAIYVLRSR